MPRLDLSCVFCQRFIKHQYATAGLDVMRFAPLNPVVPGHMLFVPVEHVPNAAKKPWIAGETFAAASYWAEDQKHDFNLITSSGKMATQSVFHLHVHYVPRIEGDGLHLPWTGQKPLGVKL